MAGFKNIYISSIYQNAGKTMVTLGLYNIFSTKGLRPAFMKPVGQQTVKVRGHNIDKDTYLIGTVFGCKNNLTDMSPVTLGKGTTEKYIFHPEQEVLRSRIQKSFQKLIKDKDSIIIEGTGHAGVGSVVDLSNADVAAMLGSRVILVAEGGIGRSIDEIMLNKALFDLRQVPVLGVIVNKVLTEKFERIKKVLTKGLERKGLPLLGAIPLDPILSSPTVGQIMMQLDLRLVCGKPGLSRRVQNTIIASMEPYNMINYLADGTLVLTSGDRVDNIMAAVSSHMVARGKTHQVSGIILTGGLVPNVKILELLRKSRIPVLMTDEDTYTVAGKTENLICKIQKTDKDKITEAKDLVKKYVDVDQILARLA